MSRTRHHQAANSGQTGRRPRLLSRRGPLAVLVATLVTVLGLGQSTVPTDAQWTDDAHAQGTVATGWWAQSLARAQLIEVDGLGLDVLDAATTSAEFPQRPGPSRGAIDIAALQSLVGLGIPALDLPLVGDGANEGLLDLGSAAGAGLLNSYAATEDYSVAAAASGTVTDDGAVDLSPVADPTDVGFARLSLTALLDDLSVGGLTSGVVSDVSLGLGAIASAAEWPSTGGPESQYVLAGAELRLAGPAVGGLVQGITGAVGELDTLLNATLGPTGPLQSTLSALSLLNLNIGLASVNLGSPQLNATVSLRAVLDELVGTPLTSSDGLVAVDLSTGAVVVDLRQLVAGGDLNGLPPSTELLTGENISRIALAVTDVLDDVTTRAVTAVQATLDETRLRVEIPATIRVLGLGLVRVQVLADITVGDLVAGRPLTLDVRGNLLGLISLDALLSGLLTPVTNLLLPALAPLVRTLVNSVPTLVGSTVGTTVGAVTGLLGPVLGPLLTQLVRITVNDQERTGPAGEETFTVRSLAVELLPVLGPASVTVGLAASSVQVWRRTGGNP